MHRIALLSLLVVVGCGPVFKSQYHEADTATMVFMANLAPPLSSSWMVFLWEACHLERFHGSRSLPESIRSGRNSEVLLGW